MSVVASMILVVAALGGSMATARALGAVAGPEVVRKCFHVGAGLSLLALPFVFDGPAPVVALAVLAVVAFVAVRRVEALRRSVGVVLAGVGRDSAGEMWFAVGAGTLFCIADGDAMAFCVPVLVLALADAAAALVGQRFGSFAIFGGRKSLEGSAAFFVVALASAHAGLVLFGTVAGPRAVLVALLLASSLAVVEAASGKGIDNLTIPLGGFAVLRMTEAAPIRSLAVAGLASFAVACAAGWVATHEREGIRA